MTMTIRLAGEDVPQERAADAWLLLRQLARLTLTTEAECGQCEGTGTTDAMGAPEECPVCDGSGTIDRSDDEEGAGEALDALIEKARSIAAGEPCNTPAIVDAGDELAGEPCNTPPIRVVAALEGGIIQGAVADRPGVILLIVDYDTDGAEDGVYDIPQSDGSTAEGFRGEITPDIDPAWIDGLQGARPSYGDEAEQLTEAVGGPPLPAPIDA